MLNAWVCLTCARLFTALLNCNVCENLHLKTLHARLEVFEKESSIFPRRAAPEAVEAHLEAGRHQKVRPILS